MDNLQLKEEKAINPLHVYKDDYTKKGSRSQAKQVLIVDDSRSSVELMNSIFKNVNCETSIATNGVEAVEMIVSNPKRFDLIILDWMMPKLNGLQTICMADDLLIETQFYPLHRLSKIPIVIYTATSPKELKAPVSSFFEIKETWFKPVPYRSLKKQAKKLLFNLKKQSIS